MLYRIWDKFKKCYRPDLIVGQDGKIYSVNNPQEVIHLDIYDVEWCTGKVDKNKVLLYAKDVIGFYSQTGWEARIIEYNVNKCAFTIGQRTDGSPRLINNTTYLIANIHNYKDVLCDKWMYPVGSFDNVELKIKDGDE